MKFPLKQAAAEGISTVNFLDSLNRAEWKALSSVSHEHTFPRGSRLVRERDGADYAMVIISGRTRMSVREDGRDWVIAEQGPGHLIDPVGALRIDGRPVCVTAMETVIARVMSTDDLAGFLGQHPRVRAIIQSQANARRCEDQCDRGGRVLAPPAGTAPRPFLSGENCTVILTDVVGFGAHERNDRDRLIIRAANLRITRTSLGSLWGKCIWEDQGDGLLIVVPTIPTATIMEHLHQDLLRELWKHNRSHGESVRIRLRVAVDVGPVTDDTIGMTGEAIIRTCRLLDAPVLKEAMTSPGTCLGMIVSTFVYDRVIRHAEGWADPDTYEVVNAHVKETRVPAWMMVASAPRRILRPVPTRTRFHVRRAARFPYPHSRRDNGVS